MNACTTTVTGITASITPHIDIDVESLPHVEAAAAALPLSVTEVTLHLEHARFMDVAGLRLLRDQRRAAKERSGRFVVTGLRTQPRRLLQLADELFPAMSWDDFLAQPTPC